MAWTDPKRYPNALEQNDPEGALNTYVIDNIADLDARVDAVTPTDSPSDGEVLTYTTAEGVNWAPASGGGGGDFVELASLSNVSSTSGSNREYITIGPISEDYSHYRLSLRGQSADAGAGIIFANSSTPDTSCVNNAFGSVNYAELYSSAGYVSPYYQAFTGYYVTFGGGTFINYQMNYDIYLPTAISGGRDISNGYTSAKVFLKNVVQSDTGAVYDIQTYFESTHFASSPITDIAIVSAPGLPHTVYWAKLWGIK